MAETKFTKREAFTKLIEVLENIEVENGEDIIAILANEIENLDKKATKARERAAAKRAEGDELQKAVLAAVTEDVQTIAEITANVDFEDVTEAKVRYRLSQLVDNGTVVKEDASYEGADGKTHKAKVYKLA